MIGLGVVVLVAVLVALPFLIEWRRPGIKPLRDRLGVDQLDLPAGVTRIKWVGPNAATAKGPIAVCLSDNTTPLIAFEYLSAELVEQGYRVLCYDYWGRGLSDTVDGAQTTEFFVDQLDGVLQALGVERDITLVGYGMGAGIALAFAAERAEDVERVVLLAPTVLETHLSRAERFCRDVPVLGDWAALVLPLLLPAQLGTDRDLAAWRRVVQQRRGYQKSVLSARRHILRDDFSFDLKELRALYVPVLAIWGGVDRVVPIRALGQMAEIGRSVRQEVVETAGHDLPLSHPSQVAKLIAQFVNDTQG
ncbi:2-hydroxymuconate semialdehyde hydrolase [Aquimixticola soesokkakensis]|uniref:2-hydroxymuconate semialdehyde hydrolase n=1 Tax=Aquimixticola soesokkakensis TaxID=1519096 RepID=A0A1Y5RFA4_9RHOB|nr:alpha/beta hydrolase [Aquimixticola soesokkakensis]SLN16126.1 2-hydroxymuconate semialdehyde hydrolase [Aquimixticola soesokkakensis]